MEISPTPEETYSALQHHVSPLQTPALIQDFSVLPLLLWQKLK
jgi:hypothetical protein